MVLNDVRWVIPAEIDDEILSDWLGEVPAPQLVGFTHKPDKADEIRILGYVKDVLVAYAFLVKSSSASFGYVVHPAFRGEGLGTACMEKIIKLARSEGRKELVSEVFSFNIASMKMMLKAGFSFYGPVYIVKRDL
jgi:RimJ/RimL family protein N-acetyltransferase